MGKRALIVFGICVGISAVALDWSILVTALPVIQYSLNAETSELQWMMNAFGILSTTFLVTGGRLADDFGRKKFFLGALILFGIGLAIAGSSQSAGMLIFARCIQGLATAILLPASQSLVRLAYPPEEVGRGLAIWSSIVGLFLALGPVAGGIIISFLNWRWIFYIAIPAIIISFIICSIGLKESENKNHGKDLDWLGLLCLIFFIGPLCIAIIEGPNWGWGSPIVIGFFVLAALALIALFLVERRVEFPIVDPDFFFNRNFVGGAIGAAALGGIVWAVFFLTPLYLHNVRQQEPLVVGLNMLWISFPVFILAPLAGKWQTKKGAKSPIVTGFLCMIAATIIFHFIGLEVDIWYVALGLLVFGIGWGVMWGPIISVGVSSIQERLSSMASGAIMTVQDVSGVLSVAVCGTIFREVAGRHLTHYVHDKDIHVPADQMIELQRSISDPEVGGWLSGVMREGFILGWGDVMYLLIVVSVITTISMVFIFKKQENETPS